MMVSLVKIFALAESELRLLESTVKELRNPWLEGDVERAKAYCNNKNVPALLASLEEIQPKIAKLRSHEIAAERITPVIRQLGAIQFKTEMNIQKKEILNQFLKVRRELRTISIITKDKYLRKLVDNYEDEEMIFLEDIFQADTPDKVSAAVHQFSELSLLARDAVGIISSKMESEQESRSEPETYALLMKKQNDLLREWNKLPSLLLKYFKDAHRRINPRELFSTAKLQGVDVIRA